MDTLHMVNAAQPTHTRQQLIQWATGCMWQGLPDDFFSAWLEYRRGDGHQILLDYQCILSVGGQTQPFQPADELYPARCVEQLDAYLAEDKRNWRVCKMTFDPQSVSVEYVY